MDKYIKLTEYTTSRTVILNTIMICTITDNINYRTIKTMGGVSVDVIEMIELIQKLIEDANKIKLVTT